MSAGAGAGGARAVFLDRDGVLIEDVHLITELSRVQVLPGVAQGLAQLKAAGFRLVVVTNQTVVARGMATEAEVDRLNAHMAAMIAAQGGPPLDRIEVCPHHPKASVEAYRLACDCRKPATGLLRRASAALGLDPSRSFLIGDRITDIVAGARAGCRTVLVQTGRHTDAPIETAEPLDTGVQPDLVCRDFRAAADWILANA